MKPQDTTACDIRQIREEMEDLLDKYCVTYDSRNNPIFKEEFAETRYYSLQTELRKLVNTKR